MIAAYIILAAYYYILIGVVTYIVSSFMCIATDGLEEKPSVFESIFKWPLLLIEDLTFIIKNL